MGALDFISNLIDKTKVGGVPVLGTIINGAKAAYHGGTAAIDCALGDSESAERHISEVPLDLAKAIPYVGTAVSAGEYVYDTGRQTAGHPSLHEDMYEWLFHPHRDEESAAEE